MMISPNSRVVFYLLFFLLGLIIVATDFAELLAVLIGLAMYSVSYLFVLVLGGKNKWEKVIKDVRFWDVLDKRQKLLGVLGIVLSITSTVGIALIPASMIAFLLNETGAVLESFLK